MKVSLVGSGVMGTSLAQLFSISEAVEELNIVIRNIQNKEKLKKAIEKSLKRALRNEKIESTMMDSMIARVHITDNYDCIAGSDFILEAVSEANDVKKEVLNSIDQVASPDAIIATNTSSFSITGLSNEVKNPENFIGTHFFNPAVVMELVEIVSGFHTSNKIIEESKVFIEKLGKKPVLVNDSPGFVVNRMLIPMINEAVCILSEGVASAEDIDKAMQFGAHHPMGH